MPKSKSGARSAKGAPLKNVDEGKAALVSSEDESFDTTKKRKQKTNVEVDEYDAVSLLTGVKKKIGKGEETAAELKLEKSATLEKKRKSDKEELLNPETVPKKTKTGEQTKLSHQKLNKKANEIGRKLREKLEQEEQGKSEKTAQFEKEVKSISALTEVQVGFFAKKYQKEYKAEEISQNFRKYKLGYTNFEERYRAWADKMDEFVSTSTVQELLLGMLEKDKPSETVYNRIGQLVDLMSVVRAPTGYVGFRFEELASASGETRFVQMQHIAPDDQQMFADANETKTEHADLDLKRKNAVLTTMEEALSGKTTAEEAVRWGVLAAIEFSLRNFMSAATAINIKPLANESSLKQLEYREFVLKVAYEILGGKVPPSEETVKQRLERKWSGPGPGDKPKTFSPVFKRQVTPPRLLKTRSGTKLREAEAVFKTKQLTDLLTKKAD
jgi:hypothetical protein